MAPSFASAPELAKEYLAAQMRLFYQLLGNLNHRLGGEQVGNMHQLVRLLVDCVNDRRIGITQTVYTDAGSKIDVLLAPSTSHRVAPSPWSSAIGNRP